MTGRDELESNLDILAVDELSDVLHERPVVWRERDLGRLSHSGSDLME